ncbi:MAG: c-type cytochrome [Pseudomonadota bacterium]
MKKLHYFTLLIVISIAGVSCENPQNEAAEAPQVEQPGTAAAPVAPSEKQMRLWASSCALCHVTGVGGAPIVGKQEDWTGRLQQDNDVLLKHTLEGFNNMPPLGYCMACETEDFMALIEFMGTSAR